ncbi:MAG TPA: glycosyltransferase family 2 protein [Syntrophales bacterium]|nr:glycosyltransferase family 2 protein [Syntrophales bacterium]
MYHGKSIALLIPARNEALSLPRVLRAVPPEIDRLVVIDNGSTDATNLIAQEHGASTVKVSEAGYGRACLAGIAFLSGDPPDIVAFADGDGSDEISRLLELIDHITSKSSDLVMEKRIPANPEAISPQQRFGNFLATKLIRLIWRHGFTDLGPMRAISWEALQDLDMRDQNFGWTIEMQIKAVKAGLKITECPLPYRNRIAGQSKVSRTLKGTMLAGVKIIWVIFREATFPRSGSQRNARGKYHERARDAFCRKKNCTAECADQATAGENHITAAIKSLSIHWPWIA